MVAFKLFKVIVGREQIIRNRIPQSTNMRKINSWKRPYVDISQF